MLCFSNPVGQVSPDPQKTSHIIWAFMLSMIRSLVMYKNYTGYIFLLYVLLLSWAMKPLEKLPWRYTVEWLYIAWSGRLVRFCNDDKMYSGSDSDRLHYTSLGQQQPKSILYLPSSNPRPYLKMSCESLLLVSRQKAMKNASRNKKQCSIFILM